MADALGAKARKVCSSLVHDSFIDIKSKFCTEHFEINHDPGQNGCQMSSFDTKSSCRNLQMAGKCSIMTKIIIPSLLYLKHSCHGDQAWPLRPRGNLRKRYSLLF